MAKIVDLWRKFSGVALRVVIEFFALATFGALWAWYRASDHLTWSVGDGVEDAFKAFFFAGYFYNYFMRAVKASDDRVRHGDIVAKQEAFLTQLTVTTDRLVGHASGGDSVGWLVITDFLNGAFGNITAHVHGKYPLLEASASVFNMDKPVNIAEIERTGDVRLYFKDRTMFQLGTLQPGVAMLQDQAIPADASKEIKRFRIDWTARNGPWVQYVQLTWKDDRWNFITAIVREKKWVFESPPREELAKRDDGKADAFWIDYDLQQM